MVIKVGILGSVWYYPPPPMKCYICYVEKNTEIKLYWIECKCQHNVYKCQVEKWNGWN